LHLVGILFPDINEDARSKSHQIVYVIWKGCGRKWLWLNLKCCLSTEIRFWRRMGRRL